MLTDEIIYYGKSSPNICTGFDSGNVFKIGHQNLTGITEGKTNNLQVFSTNRHLTNWLIS